MNDTYTMIESIRNGKLSPRTMRKMLVKVKKQLGQYENASNLVNYTTADFVDYGLWQKAHKIGGGKQHSLTHDEWLELAPHQQRSLVFKTIEAIQEGRRSSIDIKDALEAQVGSEPDRQSWNFWALGCFALLSILTLWILPNLIIAISLATVVHVMGMAAAGWLAGAPLEEINVFFGPRIKEIDLSDVTLDIRAIPLGGNVKFSDEFQNVHPIKRIFIACCGSFALICVAMMAFGVSEGFQKFVNGFYQMLSGAFAPRVQGSQYLFSLYEFLRVNSLSASIGLIASKMAAFNLLPFPVLNGGAIILFLLDWIRPMPLKFKERLQQFGFIILLVIFICWMIAGYFFLKRILF